ncbi:MAG TPA: hypothetical protein VHF58_07350 [Solirubrobacterales bacterium]|nr:hypothetical protein [Solirubrobacterales bacterium]
MAASAIAVAISLTLAAGAPANNLDNRTMTNVAKQVAKADCKDTKGCKDWRVRGLHRVSRHKALGKIKLRVVRDEARSTCTRQIVIKLNHLTGEVLYGLSRQKCEAVSTA